MDMRIPVAGLALMLALGAPVAAQQLDGGALTCDEFKQMNAADKNASLNAVRIFAKESANAAAAGVVAQTDQLTDFEFMGRMDSACLDAPAGMTIITAMRQ